MDLKIKEFESIIINTVNNYELPMEVKRLVVENILFRLEKAVNQVIENQIKKLKEDSNESTLQGE